MSSNDSTRPDAEGRTVATDQERAGQSPPDAAAEAGPAAAAANGGRAAPSPTPRAGRPEGDQVAETSGAPDVAGEPEPVAVGSAGPVEGLPPWRRVPNEQQAPDPGPARPSVADSLLSEAPTQFLTAPKAGSGAAATTTATATAPPEPSAATGDGPALRGRPPRQALLQLKRLDPWSVLKMAAALAVVLFLIWMVAAGVLYGVLGGMGVWDRLNGTYADLVTGQDQNASSLISPGRVFLLAAIVGAINSLLFAVAMTIVAFVYNVAADVVGGIEVTLSERD